MATDRSATAPAGTQAIGRALAVLRLLTEADGDLGILHIAQELDLKPGTAHRIVRALMLEGYVAQNPATDGYYLGSRAILVGQAAQRALGVDRALPLLERLHEETEESVNLVVREGDESVVLMRVQSTLPLRFEQYPGARFPLYSTASGKAMLSFSDADEYLSRLPDRLDALTPNTLGTPADLVRDLDEIRARGYSIDDEENVAGVRCVGAPVVDIDGQAHAAVVIQVPTVRMPVERIHQLGPRMIELAKQVAHVVPPDHTVRRSLSRR